MQRGKQINCWGWTTTGSLVDLLLTQAQADATTLARKDAFPQEQAEDHKLKNPLIGDVRISKVE